MKSRQALLVYGAAATLSLLTYGFVLFASGASRGHSHLPPRADAIVVLTGAERRITAGIELLRKGIGERLLISGINSRVTPEQVLRSHDVAAGVAACCIDFGYTALDTIGNANEARAWADLHRYRRLVVVTSSYHMPRSLNELALALPDVELIPYPVVPRVLAEKPWWLDAGALRLLAAEYVKFIPSYVKYAVRQLMRGDQRVADATVSDGQRRAEATGTSREPIAD